VITSQKPEHEKCLIGLTAITKEAWKTEQSTQDNREKLQEISLAKEHKPAAYASDVLYPLNASVCAKTHCNASILIHNLSVSVLCIYVLDYESA
jgi:hypothetical protein